MVVALVLTVSTGSALCIMPIMALMLAYSVGFTLVAFDERNDWERFRLTLPLSRANVVQGRYATFVVMTLVGLVLGVAVTAIVYGLSLALPQTELFAGLFDGHGLADRAGHGVSRHRVLARPLARRPAARRALRHDEGRALPSAGVHHPAAHRPTVLVQKAGPPPAFVLDLVAWAARRRAPSPWSAAVLAVMVVLSVLSCMLSVKLYERRVSSTPAPPAPPRQAGGTSAGRWSAPTGKEAERMKAMFLMDFITAKKLLRRYLLLLFGAWGRGRAS